MDDRLIEQAVHFQAELFDGLRKARDALLKLNKLRVSGGDPAIPAALMRMYSRSLEQAGQIAKNYRV